MLVKICGISSIEAAKQAINAGADFIGFVFAESKRKVSVEIARKISREIPNHVKKVGVFVNESIKQVETISEVVGLDYVQLHGDESPEYCATLTTPVIKAFQIRTKKDFEAISAYQVAFLLLDSPAGKYRGGNGEPFDWTLVSQTPLITTRIFLAGGLRPENVVGAIKEVKPMGVDVSSGVETNGQKDPAKMKAFIEAIRREDEQ